MTSCFPLPSFLDAWRSADVVWQKCSLTIWQLVHGGHDDVESGKEGSEHRRCSHFWDARTSRRLALMQEINLTLEDSGTPHTGKSKIVLSVEALL